MRNKNIWILTLALVLILAMAFSAGCNNDTTDDENDETETVSGCWDYQPTTMQPNPGWDTVDFTGLTREELIDVLGCPPHMIRMTSVVGSENNRELWVYHPFEEDPTGLYVWLKGDVFHDHILDEFNGFDCYQMINLEFWE